MKDRPMQTFPRQLQRARVPSKIRSKWRKINARMAGSHAPANGSELIKLMPGSQQWWVIGTAIETIQRIKWYGTQDITWLSLCYGPLLFELFPRNGIRNFFLFKNIKKGRKEEEKKRKLFVTFKHFSHFALYPFEFR